MDILVGTVIAVHPASQACDVLLDQGGMRCNVPIMNAIGGPQSVDMSWGGNLRGAPVALLEIRNRLHILGTLPTQDVPREAVSLSPSNTGTGGENKQTYGRPLSADYSSARTTGFLPGDKVLRADGSAAQPKGWCAGHGFPASEPASCRCAGRRVFFSRCAVPRL